MGAHAVQTPVFQRVDRRLHRRMLSARRRKRLVRLAFAPRPIADRAAEAPFLVACVFVRNQSPCVDLDREPPGRIAQARADVHARIRLRIAAVVTQSRFERRVRAPPVASRIEPAPSSRNRTRLVSPVAPMRPATVSDTVLVIRASDTSDSSNRPARPARAESAVRAPNAVIVFLRSASIAAAARSGLRLKRPAPCPNTPQRLVRSFSSKRANGETLARVLASVPPPACA